MKIKKIPSNNITAAIALLSPYAPELSATALVEAIQSYNPDGGERVRYLDKHQAASRLNVSWYSLVRWAKQGKIPGACKVGEQWRFREDALVIENES